MMNRPGFPKRVFISTAICLALAGCGGGGGSSQPLQPQAGGQPAPVPLPTEPVGFNCDTIEPQKTSSTNSLPGGIWRGTLVDCDSQTSTEVHALVSENGRFRILSLEEQSGADILSGVLTMDGNTFNGSGKYFYTDGYFCTDCWASGLFINGSIVNRDRIDGRWGADWGGYGYFLLDYLAIEHTSPVPLTHLAGTWEIVADDASGMAVRWLINANGEVTGEDSQGCSYSGQISLANPRYNLYQLEVTVSACSTDWTYAGFGFWSSGPFNDRLYVAVDNDGERALRLLFYSQ